MSTETSILLPQARVDLFLKDKETSEAARGLVDDWRFARVSMRVEEGDVETAINAYGDMKSPALVIIETDTTDESFIERLEALAGHCGEGTNAIVVGPVNDIDLYRHLISIGVSDYIVRPVAEEKLADVIARALIKNLGASGSRLITTIGAKGGVGTSSLTHALAIGLSTTENQKTFLMDAAGGWSSLSVNLGFEPMTTLHEAVHAASNQDWDVLGRMVHKANDKLSILASGSDQLLEPSIHAQHFEELLDMVMGSYPVVVADLSDSIPSLKKAALEKSHQVVIVTTPTLSSLRTARTLIQEIKTLHGGSTDKISLVLNMVGEGGNKEIPEKDIAEALDFKPSISVPFDVKTFFGSENEGRDITAEKGGVEAVQNLVDLVKPTLSSASLNKESDDEKAGGTINQFLNKLKPKK